MPPDFDGNSDITTYQVEQLQEGLNEWQPIIQQPKTTFVVKTLEPNTSYQFRITAYNDCGSSPPSEASLTVFTKPVTKGMLTNCMHVHEPYYKFPRLNYKRLFVLEISIKYYFAKVKVLQQNNIAIARIINPITICETSGDEIYGLCVICTIREDLNY